jgi:hypothetical protein
LLTLVPLAFVAISLASSASASSLSYIVTINTSAINGAAGYLDLQFNPGALPGTQSATATVQGFTSDGTLGVPSLTGDVAGALPGTLSFDNQTVFNDDFQALVFGNTISFELTLSGAAVTGPDGTSTSGSSFGIGLWDGTGINPLLTSDPDGFVGIVDLNLDGSGTPSTFPTDTGGPTVVTLAPEATTVIPEPSSIVLIGIGLTAGFGFETARRVRRRAIP